MTIILNKDDVQKRIKRNAGVKCISMIQSESAKISHPSYLQSHKTKGNKFQIGRGSTTAPDLFTIFHEFTQNCFTI